MSMDPQNYCKGNTMLFYNNRAKMPNELKNHICRSPFHIITISDPKVGEEPRVKIASRLEKCSKLFHFDKITWRHPTQTAWYDNSWCHPLLHDITSPIRLVKFRNCDKSSSVKSGPMPPTPSPKNKMPSSDYFLFSKF